MVVIHKQEEMQKYYIKEINIYLFNDDIKFSCDIVVDSDIKAHNINARDIQAHNINADDMKACNIKARDIKALDINAGDINSGDINAHNINAWDIKSGDINANNINSLDINAWDINARNIKSNNISFYAVCFARETFVCESIEGRRENSKYFCLDSDVVIEK